MPTEATVQKTTRNVQLTPEEFLKALRDAGVDLPDDTPFRIQPHTENREGKLAGGISLPVEGCHIAVIWEE